MKVLYIDDRLPCREIGYGFPRAADIVAALRGYAAEVVVWPTEGPGETVQPVPEEVFVDADLVWVSRTRNVEVNIQALLSRRHDQICIFDIEAIGSERLEQMMCRTEPDSPTPDSVQALEKRERACIAAADIVVAVNRRDACKLASQWKAPHVLVVGHEHEPLASPRGFAERRGILFVGGFYKLPCPNEDALTFLLEEVMPLSPSRLFVNHPLTVAGHNAEILLDRPIGKLMKAYKVHVVSSPPSLARLYDRARAGVIPTRIAAGMPFKGTEMVCMGLPFVTTAVIADQLGMAGTGFDDPTRFARMLEALLEDEEAWRDLHQELMFIRQAYAPGVVTQQIGEVLNVASQLLHSDGSAEVTI